MSDPMKPHGLLRKRVFEAICRELVKKYPTIQIEAADAAIFEIKAFLEEPTEEMLEAASAICGGPYADNANTRVWRAMLRTALAEKS